MEEAYHLSSSRAFLHHLQEVLFLTLNLFNKCHLCDWKMRSVKRHPWELSFSTICSPSWYLDWNLRDQVSLWIFLASLPRWIADQHTVSGKSQRLIKVVFHCAQLVQQNFSSNDWFCRDQRVLTSTLPQHWERKKVRPWEKWLLWQCTCRMSPSSWMNRCVSLRVQTLFL